MNDRYIGVIESRLKKKKARGKKSGECSHTLSVHW